MRGSRPQGVELVSPMASPTTPRVGAAPADRPLLKGERTRSARVRDELALPRPCQFTCGWRSSQPGSHVLSLYVIPFILASLVLLVGLTIRTDYGVLDERLPLSSLANVTLPALYVVFPCLIGLYFWMVTSGVLHNVARRLQIDPEERIALLSREAVNERINQLSSETYKFTGEELIAWAFLSLFTLTSYVLIVTGKEIAFIIGRDVTSIGLGFIDVGVLIPMPLLALGLRYSFVREKGNSVFVFLRKWKSAGRRSLLVQAVCVAFIIGYYAREEYPFAGESSSPHVCARLNRTYLQSRCALDEYAFGQLRCVGVEPYGRYRSNVVACTSALRYAKAVTITMSTSGFSCMAFFWWGLYPFSQRTRADTHFPCLHDTATVLLYSAIACGTAFFTSQLVLELSFAPHGTAPHELLTASDQIWINPTAIVTFLVISSMSAAAVIYFVEELKMHSHRMRQLRENEHHEMQARLLGRMHMEILDECGIIQCLPVEDAIKHLVSTKNAGSVEFVPKFGGEATHLLFGEPKEAVLGYPKFLNISQAELNRLIGRGTQAIYDEYQEHGSDEEKECLAYVLKEKAGSSAKEFPPNGKRDEGRNGETLRHFCECEQARAAELTEPEVVALRLYTTACYRGINAPLREQKREKPHPYPTTVYFLTEGIKKLRAREADSKIPDLWRGMSGVQTTADFERLGGAELALMSTSSNPAIAIDYSTRLNPQGQQAQRALLLKLRCGSFVQCGSDLTFLSCFPGEREFLYPPRTYLKPTSRKEENIICKGVVFTVIEVEPHIGV